MFDFGTATSSDRDLILDYLREKLFVYGKSYLAKVDDKGFLMVNDFDAIKPIAFRIVEDMKEKLNIFFSIKQVNSQLKTIIQSNEIDEIVNQMDLEIETNNYQIKNNRLYVLNAYKRPLKPKTPLVDRFMSHYPLKALIGVLVDGYINPRKDSFVYQIFPSNFGKSLIIEMLIQAGLATEVESLYSLSNPKENNIYSVQQLSSSICVVEDEFFTVHDKIKNITFKAPISVKFKKSQVVKMGVKLMFGANRVELSNDPQFLNRFHVLDFSNHRPITEKEWYKKAGGRKTIKEVSEYIPTLVNLVKKEIQDGKGFYDYLAEIKGFFSTNNNASSKKEVIETIRDEIEKEINQTAEEKQEKFNREMFEIIYDLVSSIKTDEYQRIGILSDTIIKKDDGIIQIKRGKSSVKKILSFALSSKQEVNSYMNNWKNFIKYSCVVADKAVYIDGKTARVLELTPPRNNEPEILILDQDEIDF